MSIRLSKKSIILFIGAILIGFSVFAQEDPPYRAQTNLESTGLWNGMYVKAQFSKKFAYYGEHHLRLRNNADNLYGFYGRNNKIYNRMGLNIMFNPYFEATVGPAFILRYAPSDDPKYDKVSLEKRIWHQYIFKMPAMGRVKVYHQFRFEHRWKKGYEKTDPFKYTNRYRYKLFAYIPINKHKIEEKTLYVSPSAELFMQSGKSVVYNPLEDFRIYNGIGYVLNRQVSFFAGHMWTIGQAATGYNYRTSHVIRLNVLIGLDFRKTENTLPQINMGY